MSNYKSNYNSNKSSVAVAAAKSAAIINYTNWDPTNHRLGPKKPNVHGGFAVAIFSNQTNAWPSIASPTMTTWGLNAQESKEDPNKLKYSLAHQFPNNEYPSPECDAFLAKIKAFEDHIVDLMTRESLNMWGKTKSRELVLDQFVSSLKYPGPIGQKRYHEAPTWQPKIRVYSDPNSGKDDWKLEIYNAQRNRVFPNNEHISVEQLLPKLAQCRSLAKCAIYISGAAWGITWDLQQTMVVAEKINRSINGVCQFDDDEPTDNYPSAPPTDTYIPDDQPELEQYNHQPIAEIVAQPITDNTPTPIAVPVTDTVTTVEAPTVEAPTVEAPTVVKKVVKKVVAKK